MFVYAEPPGPEGDTSQQGHPVYSNDQNVMIRGVHDAIAHLGGDHPFSAPEGEYGAYNRHLKTLCNVQDAKAGSCLAAASPVHGDRRADILLLRLRPVRPAEGGDPA